MSTGIPLVAPAAEGPAEYLRDQPATLVPPDDFERLAAAGACERLRSSGSRRLSYDLTPFDPDSGIWRVMDFTRQVTEARQIARLAA